MEQEIEKLNKELTSESYPPRDTSDSVKALVWAVFLAALLNMIYAEVSAFDKKTTAPVTLVGNLVLPVIGALFFYSRAMFAWNTPRRVAMKKVKEDAWARHWGRKDEAEAEGEPQPPAPVEKQSGG